MEGNPYTELIQSIRNDIKEQTPVAYRFGKVVSANPLKIETSGTIQDSFDLLRSNTVIDLEAGDSVLLLPIEDQQRFIILCKVVGA